MNERDRLAADLHEVSMEAYGQRRWAQAPWPTDMYDWLADRLIALGWTRKDSKDLTVDEERLARALRAERVRKYVMEAWVDEGVSEPGYATVDEMAAAIAKAYREDTDAAPEPRRPSRPSPTLETR